MTMPPTGGPVRAAPNRNESKMHTAPVSPLDLFLPTAAELQATAQPPGRAAAMAASLRSLADEHRPDARFSASVMRLAYLMLSVSRPNDEPPVAARRATCLEIADAIGRAHILGPRPPPASVDIGALSKVLSWWAAATLTPGDDARSAAIRETARRELAELEDVVSVTSERLLGERLLAHALILVEAARVAKQEHAYLNLGQDPMEGGRDGGPVVRVALETLRAAGYTADLDGRSGQVMIEVDNALRPVKSRREGARVDLNDTELHGEVALEALDNYVRRLRTPIGDARRDAAALRPLVAVLVQALEALPESAKVSIDLIMSALELSANEANVVADVLIAVKPALARACGVTSF